MTATLEQDQSEIIEFLACPATYGLAGESIEQHQTHGSIVFLAGDRAYKLKRAVKFPYMDFSTVGRRKAMCEAEFLANHRLAPELYLGVKPILRLPGEEFQIGGGSDCRQAVDWVVVMRRFPQNALLRAIANRNALTPEISRATAETVARSHQGAEVSIRHGGAEGLSRVIEGCASVLAELSGDRISDVTIGQWVGMARASLESHRNLLEQRRNAGKVRVCHGDLHLNNICILDGQPVLFDAIEFNDDLNHIDVLYDFAFLVMDLDYRGQRVHANIVFNRYLEISDDYDGLAAFPLFLSCRAAIRAHVSVSTAQVSRSAEKCAEAEELLELAISYLQESSRRLIAIGGLSGTGKSTVARATAPVIGRAPGAVVVRSDYLRKKSQGVSEMSRLPQKAYTAESTEIVYGEIMKRAELALTAGYCAIADAVFGTQNERNAVASTAERNATKCEGYWLSAPEEILQSRIFTRREDASDATAEVLKSQIASISKPVAWRRLDASQPASEIARYISAPAVV